MLVSAKADADNMQRGDDMSIGKVIRKYRKLRNMTQEEMAGTDRKRINNEGVAKSSNQVMERYPLFYLTPPQQFLIPHRNQPPLPHVLL